ncbi:MAG: 16S rRNA (cytosine(1402)-N(4))-methyltransferase RsmH [Micrococcaceae bacterium]
MDSKDVAQLHTPVLLNRCLELMSPAIEGVQHPVVIDATLGMGGHSLEILQRFPAVHLICIDRDAQAIELAKRRLHKHLDRVTFYHGLYSEIGQALAKAKMNQVNAVLFDLGVSSYQLDERERGFAYSYDAPLDMRMDDTAELTAQEVVNTYSFTELKQILKDYGQERFAHKIASEIVKKREIQPFETTDQLVQSIRAAVPVAAGKKGGHPAKRSFQALRIEVNQELEILKQAIPAAIEHLAVGGRIVAMSYHSLEDKIVKDYFVKGSRSSAPLDLPVELEQHKPYLKLITKGAESATNDEIQQNSRATSVRLRTVERIRKS